MKRVIVQNYVRNLIDFENSVVGNIHNFDRIEELLAKGDNVVVLANHQTEADPGKSTKDLECICSTEMSKGAYERCIVRFFNLWRLEQSKRAEQTALNQVVCFCAS